MRKMWSLLIHSGKERLQDCTSLFKWKLDVFFLVHAQTNNISSLHPSGISSLSWPFWLFWVCSMDWFSCQSSCPWWALRPRSPQLTMPAAYPHLLPNPHCHRRWPTMGITRATTTHGHLTSKLSLSHQTQSITQRWPPRQAAGRRILSTVTEAHT